MEKKGNYLLFLTDMYIAQQWVLVYTKGMDYDAFYFDIKTTDAVIRNLEILGEAANKIPQSVKKSMQIIPGMKCILCETKYLMNISG